jgi:DNA modification methylase
MKTQDVKVELLSTSMTADRYPIHKWFNFVAGYSPEYVDMTINAYKSKTGNKPCGIMDPFAGCATTNVVANNWNIPSYGVERNPFFYKIGYTKTNAKETILFVSEIADEFRSLLKKENDNNEINILSEDAKKYLLKMYGETELSQLLKLRKAVEQYVSYKYYMGYTFLSKMLEFVTTAKTDGIYKVPSSIKRSISVEEAINKAQLLFLDGKNEIINCTNRGQFKYDSSVNHTFPIEAFDLVIFSPPYLNNFDFAEMTRMQMYFWNEADSWRSISEKHRNHMLVNTTTALKLVRSETEQKKYHDMLPTSLLEKIEPIVEKLESLFKDEKKSKDYFRIIYPYLGQMMIVLKKCMQSLKTKGEIHIVISDAAFYGIHIDTQEYLKDILIALGAENIKIQRMRDRGDRWVLEKRAKSNKQLGEFEIIAIKGK